jgi:molecular chaperone DnaJ
VVINAYTPEHLNSDEKAILEKLVDAKNFNPDATNKSKEGFFSKMKDFFN